MLSAFCCELCAGYWVEGDAALGLHRAAGFFLRHLNRKSGAASSLVRCLDLNSLLQRAKRHWLQEEPIRMTGLISTDALRRASCFTSRSKESNSRPSPKQASVSRVAREPNGWGVVNQGAPTAPIPVCVVATGSIHVSSEGGLAGIAAGKAFSLHDRAVARRSSAFRLFEICCVCFALAWCYETSAALGT